MAFVIGPIAGSLAEKRGPRMVVGGGVVLLAAGLVGASLARSYTPLLVCYGVATGFGSGAIYVPLLGLIQRWFYKRRGFASGLATTGVSVGTLTFPLLAASAADAFGWRSLYVGFAIVCVSVGLFAAFVLVADPGERGLNPDGEADAATPPPGEPAISGMSLREALRDRQFYQLYFCSFGAAVLSFMALVHLPQYVAEVSGERLYAAAIISVIGLASLVSRVGGGSWADRIGRIAMIRVALALMLITSILWVANSFTNLWGVSVYFAVAALFGITYGLCIALLPTVIADSFGNREISRNHRHRLHVLCAGGPTWTDGRRIAARPFWQLRSRADGLHRAVARHADRVGGPQAAVLESATRCDGSFSRRDSARVMDQFRPRKIGGRRECRMPERTRGLACRSSG